MKTSTHQMTLLLSTVLPGIFAPAVLAAEVTFNNAWVRAMPPGHAMTAGYGTLTNAGEKPIVVTGAISPIAASTEMHISKTEGGQVTMVPLEQVVLAPGEAFELVPGGAHLMLMGIKTMPSETERVAICLITDDSDQFCTDVPVSRSAPQ